MNWDRGQYEPKPSNYAQMVTAFRGIVQDLKAQGNPDPTNDDILKENARRVRASDAQRRNAA